MSDAETVYSSVKDSCSDSEVVYQNVHRIGNSDSLFYKTVDMGGTVKLGGIWTVVQWPAASVRQLKRN